MAYDLDSGSHSVYSLHYHLILVTKYRRGVLTEARTNFIREVIDGFADKYGVEVSLYPFRASAAASRMVATSSSP